LLWSAPVLHFQTSGKLADFAITADIHGQNRRLYQLADTRRHTAELRLRDSQRPFDVGIIGSKERQAFSRIQHVSHP
jgi:hypothetical protein